MVVQGCVEVRSPPVRSPTPPHTFLAPVTLMRRSTVIVTTTTLPRGVAIVESISPTARRPVPALAVAARTVAPPHNLAGRRARRMEWLGTVAPDGVGAPAIKPSLHNVMNDMWHTAVGVMSNECVTTPRHNVQDKSNGATSRPRCRVACV